MKATEHRLGNLIYSPIQKEVVTLVAIEQGNRPITLGEMGTSSFSGFDCLEPIPLTEELLLKFGFENDDSDWLFSIDERTDIHINLIKQRFVFESYDGIIKIPRKPMFIHQLQNLYFALTGKELEISRKTEI